ncbi:ketosteroid isomerase-related protein [Novosphingobium album (ex Hu et al. 2023)]|uniref:Nuclear transport factor 2 family protein n=1 Tax=Novosphingobium album (ex Hu et al. 2023) TaxID=2930093 RepID=A0ABT0B2M6_9SPHN|nr:ketosteroid isomerase-related protein [Novosphingobium album (ex Hu et al. 2023)]MCJ2179169.1 nuclear transport factor 2 family protein [Novosphingobium album (ex Hu et al. 2023)]
MSVAETLDLIRSYYAAFNRGDAEGMLALLADDVVHEPSQGAPRKGKALFAEFLAHMNRCYAEQVLDPQVMANGDGSHASAEFMLDGRYLESDEGLPAAKGQTYHLRVGAFFEITDGKIGRVSNHYNLADWIKQVQAG